MSIGGTWFLHDVEDLGKEDLVFPFDFEVPELLDHVPFLKTVLNEACVLLTYDRLELLSDILHAVQVRVVFYLLAFYLADLILIGLVPLHFLLFI